MASLPWVRRSLSRRRAENLVNSAACVARSATSGDRGFPPAIPRLSDRPGRSSRRCSRVSPFTTQKMAKPTMRKLMIALINGKSAASVHPHAERRQAKIVACWPFSVTNRFEKIEHRPIARPSTGFELHSFARLPTTPVNAAPMIIPTARSTTLPPHDERPFLQKCMRVLPRFYGWISCESFVSIAPLRSGCPYVQVIRRKRAAMSHKRTTAASAIRPHPR